MAEWNLSLIHIYLEQLIVCADDAMYQVKKNGKNDFAFYKKPEEEKTDNTQ